MANGTVTPAAGGGLDPKMMMLMQYLSTAGSAISQNQPVAPAINQVTNANMANQSQLKLMQALLGGGAGGTELPEGAKVSMDNVNTTWKIPSSALKGMTGDPRTFGLDAEANSPAQAPNPGMGSEASFGAPQFQPGNAPQPSELAKSPYVNPSSSPLDNLTAADLVGLTPKDLMQALQFKLMKNELAGKQADRKSVAATARMNANTARRNSDVSMLNAIRAMGKDERTSAIQNFEFAQSDLGGKWTGTFAEFQRDARTTHGKDYDKAYADDKSIGSFNEWLRDITALGGGMNLQDKKDVRLMQADVDAISYLSDPKGLSTDVDKYINTESAQNELFQLVGNPSRHRERKAELEAAYIRKKILAIDGAKIIDIVSSGHTLTWKIKYKDGSTGEISRDF
jgi:hypothetical protein